MELPSPTWSWVGRSVGWSGLAPRLAPTPQSFSFHEGALSVLPASSTCFSRRVLVVLKHVADGRPAVAFISVDCVCTDACVRDRRGRVARRLHGVEIERRVSSLARHLGGRRGVGELCLEHDVMVHREPGEACSVWDRKKRNRWNEGTGPRSAELIASADRRGSLRRLWSVNGSWRGTGVDGSDG